MSGSIAMYTLWTLVEALTTAGASGGLQAIERTVTGPLEIESETDFTVFYTGRNPELIGHSEITNVRVVLNKEKGLSALSVEIAGACITVPDLGRQFPDAYIVDSPRSPSPDDETTWASRTLEVPVLFGFKNKAADCLAGITIDFRRHLDTYDPYPEKRGK